MLLFINDDISNNKGIDQPKELGKTFDTKTLANMLAIGQLNKIQPQASNNHCTNI